MNIETMEGRTLFSVTVSQPTPGYYQFDGDSEADEITLTLDVDTSTLTYNDTQYTGVEAIAINGGGGDDSISLTSNGPGFIRASIDGAEGNDYIVCNFDASIYGGSGSDEIHLGDAFQGEVYGEGGDDFLYVSGYSADAIIDGGAGDDWIDASENQYGVTIYGGTGDDQIYGSNHGDTIYGGEGADTIVALAGDDSVYTAGDGAIDWIDGGTGNDTLYADTTEVHIQNVENMG